MRSDARRQFKDEYSKKLDLELDVSKGRLGMHGKGFYIVVNGDVDYQVNIDESGYDLNSMEKICWIV